MSINPATDIVLDVARAADPARYKRAVARLDATAGAGFADSLAAEATPPARPPQRTAAVGAPLNILPAVARTAHDAVPAPTQTATAGTAAPQHVRRPAPKASDAATDRTAATYRQFEAMALANMLQAAMPGDDDSFFGKGVAGSTWKTMLVDQIATELAKHGGIGIADQLARSETGRSAPAKTTV